MNERPPDPILPETWTVKEVVADLKADLVGHLNKQDIILTGIDRKVDSKADKADLASLASEVRAGFDDHGHRITTLEDHKLEMEAQRKTHSRIWAAIGTVAGIAAILGATLLSHILK